MRKILLLSICFIILGITGCENKANKNNAKQSREEVVLNKYEIADAECQKSRGALDNSIVTECSYASVGIAEEDMDILLKKIYTKLKDDELAVNALKEYQAAWAIFLEAEVEYESREVGPLVQGSMKYNLISERINYLNQILKDTPPAN